MKHLLFLIPLILPPSTFSMVESYFGQEEAQEFGLEEMAITQAVNRLSPFMRCFGNARMMIDYAKGCFKDSKKYSHGYATLALATAFQNTGFVISGEAPYELSKRLLGMEKGEETRDLNLGPLKPAGLFLMAQAAQRGNWSAQKYITHSQAFGITIPEVTPHNDVFEQAVVALKNNPPDATNIKDRILTKTLPLDTPLTYMQHMALAVYANEVLITCHE